MRSAFFSFVLLLWATVVLAQINPSQINWPLPACANPAAPWVPGGNTCVTVSAGGGLPINNPQYTGTLIGPTANITNLTSPKAVVNGSMVFYPEWYGAVGDDSHDDTAAIQAAFAAGTSGSCTVRLASKIYKITGTIDVGVTSGTGNKLGCALIGDPGAKLDCSPSTPINACVRSLNGGGSLIQGVHIQGNSHVTYALEHTTTGSAENQVVRDVIIDGGPQYGWAIGPDTHLDLAQVNGYQVFVNGAVVANYLVGDGTQGNVLDIHCYGCVSDNSGGDGVLQNGGGFQAPDMSFDSNHNIDWHVQQIPGNPIVFNGARAENSKQFFYMNDGLVFPSVGIHNTFWNCGPATANTYAIENWGSNTISITDSQFSCAHGDVRFRLGYSNTNPTYVYMRNVQTSYAGFPSDLQTWANAPNIVLDSCNDIYADPTTLAPARGSGKCYQSSSPVITGAAFNVDANGNMGTQGAIRTASTVSNLAGGFGPYSNTAIYSNFDAGQVGPTSPWKTDYCNAPTPGTFTPNTTDVTDPQGGHTALKIHSQSVVATGCLVATSLYQRIAITPGQTYTMCFQGRGAVGGEGGNFGLADTGASADFSQFGVTTSWKQYSVTAAAPSGTFILGFVLGLSPNETFYIANAQVVQGASCGLYAHTTSTAVPLTLGYTDQYGNSLGTNVPNLNSAINVANYAAGSGSGGLVEAYAACPATGCALALSQDITITTPQTFNFTPGKPVVIDGQGHRLTCTLASAGVCLKFVGIEAGRDQLIFRDLTEDGSVTAAGSTGMEFSTLTDVHVTGLHIQNFVQAGSQCAILDKVEDSTIDIMCQQDFHGITAQNATNNNDFRFWINYGGASSGATSDLSGIALLIDGSGGNRIHGLIQSCKETKTVIVRNGGYNKFDTFWFENDGDSTSASRLITLDATTVYVLQTSFIATNFGAGDAGALGYEFTTTNPSMVWGTELQGGYHVGYAGFADSTFNGYPSFFGLNEDVTTTGSMNHAWFNCNQNSGCSIQGLALAANQLASGVSTNTDTMGSLSLSSATTATYSFVKTQASGLAPVCHWQTRFNAGTTTYWDTSTVTQAQVTFSAPVTGTVTYQCIGYY